MIQSYKKKYRALDKYDVLMIGSGMGCLSAASILAKENKRVLILERHYTAGGFTHIFKRRGYEWDVGIHYIGEVQRKNSAIKIIFDYITDCNLKWADMGDVYDKIIIGEKKYNLVKGVSNFKKQILEYFPKEEIAINKYVDLVFASNRAMKKFYMSKVFSKILDFLIGGYYKKDYLKYSNKTTHEVLSGITKNKKLIKVLTGQYGDYGLPPMQSSFAMHASVVKHYFDGGSFPIGGSSKIVETIDPIIEKNSGTIIVNAEVKSIIIDKGRAVGVKMVDGKLFYADSIISGIGIFNTYKKLIPIEIVQKHNLLSRLKMIKPSVSHGCLYIGLKGSPEDLKLPKHNLWIYPEKGSHDDCVKEYLNDINADFPLVYISFPSSKDPDWSNRYPGKSTIDIITLLPYDIFTSWQNTEWMNRGEDYDNLKEAISSRLLDILFKELPHLRDKLDHYELSSPLTTKKFVNYDRGELYGIDHTPERFSQKFLKPETEIKNFYLTGQDIVTAGVGGALFSGLLTAIAVSKKNLFKKIKNSVL
ncbi:MAG: FAD-dependent oxidoreductase [Flavobacteriaceae bacterium]|nr:FAD-dependent oxidoreductase [Flavobacteriaceae bacterium]|tara:strand:+ start:80 stop:1675 length:1596 start_codon:yes stop_codon:yes gene_type:complete